MNTAVVASFGCLLAGLLVANLGFTGFVALRMRGDHKSNSTLDPGFRNPYIAGWRHPGLRGAMLLWTALILATGTVFCGTMGAILL